MKQNFKEIVCKEFDRRWNGHTVAHKEDWKKAWQAVVDDVFHQFDKDKYGEIGSDYNEAINFEENVRVCDHCGKPMASGYYLGGEYACSDACCLALYNGDMTQMKEDLSHAAEDDSDVYFTDWEGNYFID